MFKNIFLCIFCFLFLLTKTVWAISDPLTSKNNRFGIHIFEPNEIEKAAELVNSKGGAWGYVTVPLRSDDRNREKWNEFMRKCREKQVIPIIRLATTMKSDYWTKPSRWDAIDFANFLNDLDWPVINRYVIVYNEPNHHNEWGNILSPEEYANELAKTIEIFKARNDDFFMLPAGLDIAAPNDKEHISWKNYLAQMYRANPDSLKKIDGWNSHSYPNPAFANSPYAKNEASVNSFLYEIEYLKKYNNKNLPIFITETGWSREKLDDKTISGYYEIAFSSIWNKTEIVAVTPFVLEAHAGPFENFAFIGRDGYKLSYEKILSLSKEKGEPMVNNLAQNEKSGKIMGAETNFEEVSDADKKLFDLKNFKNMLKFFK